MICPECEVGKHGNCNGDAWDFEKDELTYCHCIYASHQPGAYVRPANG